MRLPTPYLAALGALCSDAPSPRRILRLERGPEVRGGPLARTIGRLSREEGWLLRWGLARFLEHGVHPDTSVGFTLTEASTVLGALMGDPTGHLCRARAGDLAGGLIVETRQERLALGCGVAEWLITGEIAVPDVTPLAIPTWLQGTSALSAPAARLTASLGDGLSIVLRCDDALLGAAVAWEGARASGHAARCWFVPRADEAELDAVPLLTWAAGIQGHETVIAFLESEERRFGHGRPLLAALPRRSTRTWRILAEEMFGTVRLGPADRFVDLEPLHRARSVHEEGPPLAGVPGGLDCETITRAVQSEGFHRAFYGGLPPGIVPGGVGEGRGRRQGRMLHGDPPEPLVYEDPGCTLADLVCHPSVLTQLQGAADRARRGARCVVVLHGPPGSGKTMAGRCVAGSAGLPVARLQASGVRGPLVGMEEDNLDALFASLAARPAVLLVDEADSWLGRRQGSAAVVGGFRVGECSEILLRLEHFQGVAVLTTNREEVLDPALYRRTTAWIHLGLPDVLDRLVLWGLALAGRDDLTPADLAILAAWPLTGGDIRAACAEASTCGARPSVPSLCDAARRRAEQRRLLS